ncbi:MAG: spore maturation protein [Candidatus Marinimicrobia bacterium]|nr:spore maturation protein [Candidatus Neomarinimicrobiota bacterium]MCF7830035.1 spore maturation protein [Candidatus Neomarinimicrobiota bacterium]
MFESVINGISALAIPIVIVVIPVYAYFKKVKVYEVFVEGAKEGFQIGVKIIPFLVAILAAIGVFRASGAMDLLVKILGPVTDAIGMPAELITMAIMRPLSGSGALGVMTELVNTHGADSMIGRMASTMMGSTETTFYVLAVYFGSVSIKNERHAVPAALLADLTGIIAAVFICNMVF